MGWLCFLRLFFSVWPPCFRPDTDSIWARTNFFASIVAESAGLHWSFRCYDAGHIIHNVVDASSSVPSFTVALCQLRACAAYRRSSVHFFWTATKTVVVDSVCGFSANGELVFSAR
jgi:hypothetical protein